MRGHTQESFGDLVGLHRQTIAQYEGGTRDPSASKVALFAQVLECETNDLFKAPEADPEEGVS